MTHIDRRAFAGTLAGGLLLPLVAGEVRAQTVLTLMSAGQGSAFLPYAQGIAKIVAATRAATLDVKESKGSIENLTAVDASATTLGTAFLGSVYEAVNGIGFAAGRKQANVRALFPMYETAFMTAALRASNLTTLKSLDGKKVGCGPAGGPGEGYFRAAAEIAGIKPTILSGAPAEQGQDLIAGRIDAFWQGAVVPIPSFVPVANSVETTVFGLSDAEVAAMRQRFPFMAEAAVAPGVYRGQTAALKSVAAWNIVVGHKDLPFDLACALVKAVLTSKDLVEALGPPGRSTNAENAGVNKVVPYHPGAVKALAELGVKVE
jgi:TRAP transporter TAXI family solute receptor